MNTFAKFGRFKLLFVYFGPVRAKMAKFVCLYEKSWQILSLRQIFILLNLSALEKQNIIC